MPKLKILLSVAMLDEGFDIPSAKIGVFLRPTLSMRFWMQACGRVLRAKANDNTAYIIDPTASSIKCGNPKYYSSKEGEEFLSLELKDNILNKIEFVLRLKARFDNFLIQAFIYKDIKLIKKFMQNAYPDSYKELIIFINTFNKKSSEVIRNSKHVLKRMHAEAKFYEDNENFIESENFINMEIKKGIYFFDIKDILKRLNKFNALFIELTNILKQKELFNVLDAVNIFNLDENSNANENAEENSNAERLRFYKTYGTGIVSKIKSTTDYYSLEKNKTLIKENKALIDSIKKIEASSIIKFDDKIKNKIKIKTANNKDMLYNYFIKNGGNQFKIACANSFNGSRVVLYTEIASVIKKLASEGRVDYGFLFYALKEKFQFEYENNNYNYENLIKALSEKYLNPNGIIYHWELELKENLKNDKLSKSI